MKESYFIKKNIDDWKEYEQVISIKDNAPNKLSKLFIKITDDLSYANTYYNNRSVRVYLNGIAKVLFNQINRSERFRFSNIAKFFSVSVPLAIYEARKEFYLTCALFIASMIIGVFSSKYDPEFAQLILGDSYVKMTQENIAKNDPMAVYKSMAPFDMFFAITLNNCLVAIRTFVMGFFMAIGTILIMLHNGVMVGTFQYFFVEHGMFKESFLTIWQHGVFEISSIIMSGAAGLVLGKGLVFPGNYTRFQSLRISARRGLKLLLGIIPILVIAGFIEGFYTRYTEAPELVRIITILLSLTIIIGYFIVLPLRRNKQYPYHSTRTDYIESNVKFNFDVKKIFSASDTFMLTFAHLKTHTGKIFKWSFLVSLLFPISYFTLNISDAEFFETHTHRFTPLRLLSENYIVLAILMVCFTALNTILSKLNLSEPDKSSKIRPNGADIMQMLLLIAVSHLPLLIPNSFFAIILYIPLMIYSSLIVNIYYIERKGLSRAINDSFVYLKGSFSMFLTLSGRYLIMGVLFYWIFIRLIAALNNELIQLNLYGTTETAYTILFYANMFYFSFILLFVYSVYYIGNQILYYSLVETVNTNGLKERINSIGNTKRTRGLLRE